MFEFLQATNDTSDLTTYTFSSQNLGDVAADRLIIVGISSRKAGGSTTISSVTIGGVTATVIQNTNTVTNTDVGAIAYAVVPSGTTGDIVIVFGAGMVRCAIQVYRAINLESTTPYDSDTSLAADPTVNLDVPAGGFAIGTGITAANSNAAWTGLTEDHDNTLETFVTVTSASDEFLSAEAGRTILINFGTSNESVGVFASWKYAEEETPTPPIVMNPSNNFVDGAATTPRLTPPSGKTVANFTSGKINETSNPATAIDIGSNGYTEIEWCLKASDNAEDGATYEFRITNNGTPIDAYSIYPEWTIGGGNTLLLLGVG